MNATRRTTTIFAMITLVVLAALVHAQTPAPAKLDGTWTGMVTSEMGTMKLVATLKTKNGVVTGELQTAHGVFVIAKGEFKAGKWVLPFATGDGDAGAMSGVITGDLFEGDWDFSPRAVGTFSLKRTK